MDSRRPVDRTLRLLLIGVLAIPAGYVGCTGGGERDDGGTKAEGPWSPRNADLLFMSTRGKNADLFLRKAGDTAWVNITNSPDNENWPEWSPDGTRIAYQTNKGGRLDVWVMQADGTNPVQLTDHADHDYVPSWSPDGTRITFTSWRMEAGDTTRGPHIYIMNADGSDERRLVPADLKTSSGVSWSPDGKAIVFSRGYGSSGADLYLRELTTGVETQLTQSDPYDGAAAFSPDGSQIAFYADDGDSSVIAIIRPDGSGYRAVASTGFNWYPRWSPDGEWLIYSAAESAGSANIDLYTVSARGGAPMPLVTGPAREVEGRWRPMPGP